MRTRNIKPGFFKNDILGSLPPLCRILFSGLWCLADREGRLEDRPLRIKAEILPFDNCDTEALLAILDENGFIKRYKVGNDKFIEITKFYLHQHPHMKEPESVIPSPEEARDAFYEPSEKACEEKGESKETVQNGGKTALSKTESNEHRESTGKAPDRPMSSPSLNLKPYTLNPIPSSLKRNSSAKDAEKCEEEAMDVLNHFENKTGICYRDKKSRLYPIKSTLSKGFTKEELMGVTDRMCSEWKGTKYEKLLTPSLLFGDRFEEYLNRAPFSATSPTVGGRLRFNSYENSNTYSDLDLERLMAGATKKGKSE